MLAKAALSLVVVSLVATALAAPASNERMTFSEWRHSSKTAGNVQAKTASGEYEKADVKHLCLQEKQQYKCQYVGCPDVGVCSENSQDSCQQCTAHYIGMSDLECCKPKDYGYEEPPSLMPSIKVGTCDWDMDLYKCYMQEGSLSCQDPIDMDKGTYKLGTAWATCYLNADSEYCGHPFCDRMVLSFQGGVYLAPAWAKGTFTPLDGVTTDPSEEIDGDKVGCFPLLPPAEEDTQSPPPPTYPPPPSRKSAAAPATGKSAAKGDSARKAHKRTSALARAIASTGITQKLKHSGKKSGKRGVDTPVADPDKYYPGFAIMFSGPVTVTSLDKQVDYSRGMLDYVASFMGDSGSGADSCPDSDLIVRPNTYDITLASDKAKDSYGDEYKPEGLDGYKPDGPEYYKGGDGKEYYKGGDEGYKGGERPEYYKGGEGEGYKGGERPEYYKGGKGEGYKGGERPEYYKGGDEGYKGEGEGYKGGEGKEYYKADSYRGQGYPKGAGNYQKGPRDNYRGSRY